ncbi:MAG: hypothetical protein LM577_05540 [Thermoproteaceae archaeon]|jgi:hypothetical protein|nr:hypothetical protein [Thermoproteaceae archaeon]
MEEVIILALSLPLALAVIAVVGHAVLPALAGAAATAAEYAELRDAPVVLVSLGGRSVAVCVNSTAPRAALVHDCHGGLCHAREARRGCRVNPGGLCAEGEPGGRAEGRRGWPYCEWYLGRYRVGDVVAFELRGERARVFKNYTVRELRR